MCESDKGGGCAVGIGLVGLYLKSALMGTLSALSGKWLILGGAVPPGSSRLQNKKSIRIQKIKDRANTPCSKGEQRNGMVTNEDMMSQGELYSLLCWEILKYVFTFQQQQNKVCFYAAGMNQQRKKLMTRERGDNKSNKVLDTRTVKGIQTTHG